MGLEHFTGALFLNTLRSVFDDDPKWFALIHDYFQQFKYRTTYLRHTALPALELTFDDRRRTVSYRWKADERAFAMPIRVGSKDRWQLITPTTEWQTMPTTLKKDEFEVATDLYYVTVSKP